MSDPTSPSAENVVMIVLGDLFTATLSELPVDRIDALREVFFAGAKAASKALGREDCVQALEAQCDELAKTFGDRALARTSLPREELIEQSEPTIQDWYKTSPIRAELEKLGPAYVELWDRLEGERAERQAQEQSARASRGAINPVLRIPGA